MSQHIPSKPDYLSDADFDYILDRDGRRCVFAGGPCPHGSGAAVCDERLDFDHAQPRELGGDDTVGNIRLLCSNANRGRKLEPLKKWNEKNHWDENVVPAMLREVQRLAAWDAIDDVVSSGHLTNPHELRRYLLGNTTFLAGATGIGKTILALSAFFKINQVIGIGYPRVKNVLWLATDTTLRDTGRVELASDVAKIKFAAGPTVHVAKSFADISGGPNGSDLKIATTQSLWEVEKDGAPRHGEKEIRNALQRFDTIVFDECDWGTNQMRKIAQLASHALQFALTASPPVADVAGDIDKTRQFLKRFVLITTEAIADYDRAVSLDRCLKVIMEDKELQPWAKHNRYVERQRGAAVHREGQMEPAHPLYSGVIMDAVSIADHLETEMRELAPNEFYSPHIMVRLARINDVRALRDDLQEKLKDAYRRKEIKNPGWDVSMIFQGHERYLKQGERDQRDLSSKRHPFMLALNNHGRAVEGSMRILLMCQIGVRGINNWTVSHIVDCTETLSMIELIQFDIGRPLRWPRELAEWLEKPEMAKFTHTRVLYPQSDFQDSKRAALIKAATFVRNMLTEIGGAGFLTWGDLLQGRKSTDDDVNIDPVEPPLSAADKYRIQDCLGRALLATGAPTLTEQLVPVAIDQGFRQSSEKRRQKMIKYGEQLISPLFRQDEIGAASLFKQFDEQPANVMEKLEPQDKYDIDDLIRWVRIDAGYKDVRLDCIEKLKDNDMVTVHLVSRQLHERQVANYRASTPVHQLQDNNNKTGILDDLSRELMKTLTEAQQRPVPEHIGKIYRAINGAANKLFKIEAGNGGPMDVPAYHNAILGRYRNTLINMARAKLIEDGVLGVALQRMRQ